MSDVAMMDQLVQEYERLKGQVQRVIVGQEQVLDEIIYAIFSGGHVLLVGVPGLAKTLMVQTVAKALGLKFNRIQFTPDLMPSDILGSEILDTERNFKFIKGPIFSQIILADEINRTPPKTQAALLEAMQERSVTIAGVQHELDQPYFVLATQNPIEQEGTYPLPEAQLDRFMFAINLTYPSREEEIQIVKATTTDQAASIEPVFDGSALLEYQKLIRRMPVADNVVEYAVNLVTKTRPNDASAPDQIKQFIDWGAGPRASQNLILAAKTHAALNGKYSPDVADIKAIALPVLRHRLLKNYKAEAEGKSLDSIIESLY
ncbi:MAG: AAA family ATPase [Flavobacteriaceae bacterium]